MIFTYCPHCGSRLTQKEIGDEGKVPFCENCSTPIFNFSYTCIITIAINEFNEAALIRQGYVSENSYVCVAGYIQRGEDAEDAAAREVKEEIGLDAVSVKYINSYYFKKKDMLMIGFICRVKKDTIKLSKEVDSAEWFPLSEAKSKLGPHSIGLKMLNEYDGMSSASGEFQSKSDKNKNIAVLFPGVKYSCDKPLLNYARKSAASLGCDTLCISYLKELEIGNINKNDIYNISKGCLNLIKKYLKLKDYENIFFISKSVGTIAAGKITEELGFDNIYNIYLTPVKYTIPFIKYGTNLTITGSKDNFFSMDDINSLDGFKNSELHIIKDADHSLEVKDDLDKNLDILKNVIHLCNNFIKNHI